MCLNLIQKTIEDVNNFDNFGMMNLAIPMSHGEGSYYFDDSSFTAEAPADLGGFNDFDISRFWDLPDANLVLFNWQQAKANLPEKWINQRPSVVGLDLLNGVLFNWQQVSTLAVAPEPGTLRLLGAALLGLIGLPVKR